ncbi:MAG: FAD binding domain-containing protein [Rubrivivax sp.]|nr:FAD binding domain-containing protein [Rubrivivax sp.]
MSAVAERAGPAHAPSAQFARYLAPYRLIEALAALAAPGGGTVLAGGTDLMLALQNGRVKPAERLVNIRRVAGLDAIKSEGGRLSIGALVTVSQLLADPLVAAHAPLLGTAAAHFASEQIRNAATVGGNLGNASPAADLAPPLLALDAKVVLARLEGDAVSMRWLPLAEFFTGPGRTARDSAELIVAVEVPQAAAGAVQRFYKGGTREGLDISSISLALAARRGNDGCWHDVRLALGAVAPRPIRAAAAEAALEGAPLDAGFPAVAARAARAAAELDARPIDDVRASAWYRRELVRNMTERMLLDAARPGH